MLFLSRTRRLTCTLLLVCIFLMMNFAAPQIALGGTFDLACGDTTALVNAINQANDEGVYPGLDTINLAAGCTYNLTTPVFSVPADGPIGLPVITTAITINGNGATIQRSSASAFGIFYIAQTGNLSLENITLTRGNYLYGGAIHNERGTVTLVNSTVSNNHGFEGGGIYNEGGYVRVENSTVTGNEAYCGAGIELPYLGELTVITSTISNNSAHYGGGIDSRGTATLIDSTVSGNRTEDQGAGIANWHSLTLVNSTIYNNTAGAAGGGISSEGTTTTVINSTIAGNTGLTGGGIYAIVMRSKITLINTTISGNTASSGSQWGSGVFNHNNEADVLLYSSIVAPNTLVGNYREVSRNFVSGNPLLGSLQANGGATLTMMPLPGSPVVDAATTCDVTADQRGVARPIDGDGDGTATCDLGAVETPLHPIPPTPGLMEPTSSSADHLHAQASLCANLDSTSNPVIRARIPTDTVPKGSVFCRIVAENSRFRESTAEVGIPAVLNQSIIQAVDVFGLLHTGFPQARFNFPVTVCLQGNGMLLYLDATFAPRSVVELPVFSELEYTCANIPNAGTVVLVEGTPAPANAPLTTLTGCMVTTSQGIMNLRAAPDVNSAVLAKVPYNVTLTAVQRQGNWFHVDDLGTMGWLSAAYVTLAGACEE